MAVPIITALKMWAGTLFTKDDWDFNFSQIVSWLADGNADLVVNTIKTTNGLDLDGAQISNLGAATTGSQAITLDQATTILNRSSYYYPFSVASGKVDSNGEAAYLQKDSDTQVTVLAGNVNPDLVCIMSDGTIESVTSNTVLTVQVSDGTYHIIKEKEQAISITAGATGKVTVGKAYPASPNIGDYFCDNSVAPFKGYKYTSNGWEATEFCWLGDVSVSSGVATVKQFQYNDNKFDVTVYNSLWTMSDLTLSTSTAQGSYTLDFSSYLPNDGYTYEVIFSAYGTSGGNNYPTAQITNYGLTFLLAGVNESQVNGRDSNCFTLPVPATRTLTMKHTASWYHFTLDVIGYKRI